MRALLPIVFICLVGVSRLAGAQTQGAPAYTAKPGEQVLVSSAPCIEKFTSTGKGALKQNPDGSNVDLLYTPAQDDPAEVSVSFSVGGAPATAGGGCANPIQQKAVVRVDKGPEVPAGALNEAFRFLFAAFVLALLLESAFALLFNWRLFQEYFVGKAWRSPIMFLVSLVVVRQFNLDLLSSLFNAYQGAGSHVEGNWLTSVLTAMVISGGSAGVNRILVGLGFRSAVSKADEEKPRPARNEAYISVEIAGKTSGRHFALKISEADVTDLPATLGVIPSPRRPGLFPSNVRLPRSGGFRLSSEKAYRIIVEDIQAKTSYDVTGRLLGQGDVPTLYRFASGAVIDFVTEIENASPLVG